MPDPPEQTPRPAVDRPACPHCGAVYGQVVAGRLRLSLQMETAGGVAVLVEVEFKKTVTFTCGCKRPVTWTAGAPARERLARRP